MEEILQHVVDKTGWPDGPWMIEPDRFNWTTQVGLDGMTVRNYRGVLCGYAAVPSGHPLYGVDFDRTDGLSAHMGINYSDRCAEPICHVPEPGRPGDVWWFGFDCGHGNDFAPGEYARFASLPNFPPDLLERFNVVSIEAYAAMGPIERIGAKTYKHLGYVQAEVEELAKQIVAGDFTIYPSAEAKFHAWLQEMGLTH